MSGTATGCMIRGRHGLRKAEVHRIQVPEGTGRAMDYLEWHGLREAEKRFKPLVKRTFACREDAVRTLERS